MKRFVERLDRGQSTLFPASLDDYVTEDNPVRAVDVFVDSLEPRWFYGIKSFSETSIGSVPGALANAVYNACGVRIREHPITREKIMAGLKAQGARA